MQPSEDVEPVEDTSTYRFDIEKLRASMSPATRRNHDRYLRVIRWQMALYRACPWTRGPLLGFVYDFWIGLLDEGPWDLLKPRWGGITFAYLNDGIKPTVWHTVMQVLAPGSRYDGIYPRGAPRNKAEADSVGA